MLRALRAYVLLYRPFGCWGKSALGGRHFDLTSIARCDPKGHFEPKPIQYRLEVDAPLGQHLPTLLRAKPARL